MSIHPPPQLYASGIPRRDFHFPSTGNSSRVLNLRKAPYSLPAHFLHSRDRKTMYAHLTSSALVLSLFAARTIAYPVAISDASTSTKIPTANDPCRQSRLCTTDYTCCEWATTTTTEPVPGHIDVNLTQRLLGFLLQASS